MTIAETIPPLSPKINAGEKSVPLNRLLKTVRKTATPTPTFVPNEIIAIKVMIFANPILIHGKIGGMKLFSNVCKIVANDTNTAIRVNFCVLDMLNLAS